MELASELLSGPDLGGGFLLQLTSDHPPLAPAFTFHLQEGGTDGGVALPGSPGSLGYRHPAVPCMYGGPGCWHKSFDAPGSALASVRVAYNRTRFVLAPMLAQAEHRTPAPIARGLTETLALIAPALAGAHAAWQVGGSAAAYVRGVALEPADIDLGVAPAGVDALASALEPYSVEPRHGAPPAGAAFVGTFQSGIRVEWGATQPASGSMTEWSAGWEDRVERVPWGGLDVPLAPLEYELVRLAERGRTGPFELVLTHLARSGADRGLLLRLFDRSSLDPSLRRTAESRLGMSR